MSFERILALCHRPFNHRKQAMPAASAELMQQTRRYRYITVRAEGDIASTIIETEFRIQTFHLVTSIA